ncbi:MAG: diphosphomevalonate decarboxylase [Flavobacteriaceae bacterium]|nr:diphosphomevalonate decarboxylase [Flavobacteriaceae bacterium]MCY4268274.1 diphosphomevalonate decarboxylase [Flavobacteriaceae bacterium]MCY4298500.1 diphosphomevalonate decarboxylase [Flavobacteriaceae bacterium]
MSNPYLSILKTSKSRNYSKQIDASIETQAPSNIALVKYWGKKELQIPINPSISFTLSKATTQTHIIITPKQHKGLSVDFTFDAKPQKKFESKIKTFFNRLIEYCPWILNHHFKINSNNTFPHSSGIASSASSMASIAIGLVQLEKLIDDDLVSEEEQNLKASFLARLGSGSASRSIEGPLVIWGESRSFNTSSNYYGLSISQLIDVHQVFSTFCDTILIVDKNPKKVSSTHGHQMMNNHPFYAGRMIQAENHISSLREVLNTGDIQRMIPIVEREALSLHGLMLSSSNYYLLLQPNTVKIIHRILDFRTSSKLPIMFSLDAGPNIHLLYPLSIKQQVEGFIKNELFDCFIDLIDDQVGHGTTWSFNH